MSSMQALGPTSQGLEGEILASCIHLQFARAGMVYEGLQLESIL